MVADYMKRQNARWTLRNRNTNILDQVSVVRVQTSEKIVETYTARQ